MGAPCLSTTDVCQMKTSLHFFIITRTRNHKREQNTQKVFFLFFIFHYEFALILEGGREGTNTSPKIKKDLFKQIASL